MVYNNPIAYGVDVTPEILKTLADTRRIVCIKEETGDVRRITTYRSCSAIASVSSAGS